MMDKPYKIIWKYKNDNRYVQYNINIFVGNVDKKLKKILEKIQNLNLFDSLIGINIQESKLLQETYGEDWYKYFYNTHHIMDTINYVNKDNDMKNDLVKKYGNEWYNNIFGEKNNILKKVKYGYSSKILEENLKKMKKKSKENDDDTDINDYRTKKEESPLNYFAGGNMAGGKKDESLVDETENNIDDYQADDYQADDYQADDYQADELNEEDDESQLLYKGDYDDEVDIEEIEKLYATDVDKNAEKTTEMIEDVLDKDISEKTNEEMIEFDKSDDVLMRDTKLKNIYKKNYVFGQFIYEDDKIKTIKDKICCGLKNNSKFGTPYLIPSRQYLWGEYVKDGVIDSITIGHKWVRRNELLDIDVEPNTKFYVYEELKGKLATLRMNMKRYGSKIRYEDDETGIMMDYGNYVTNNEIYMLDLYNEFGINYNPSKEVLRNVIDVYMNLYFHKIKSDDLRDIISMLNRVDENEMKKAHIIFETINNDIVMENEIMNIVTETKKKGGYEKYFKGNYVTLSVIHVSLKIENNGNIDLYRIFNEFDTSKEYPFVQYHTIDGGNFYKFDEEEIKKFSENPEKKETLYKWFENAPYGITFKVPMKRKGHEGNIKYMSIGLNESARMEYKSVWQESDAATINEVNNTYFHVRDLIDKMNKENKSMKIINPEDDDFKFAFINTIQRFDLPNDRIINHNDLSEFSRYFYPYITLEIDPRKRRSKKIKEEEKSKFGTYLRYKRVSKYDNSSKIEQRIYFFMKNYDLQESRLITEIARQFNLTEKMASEYVKKTKNLFPNMRKNSRVLKKLEVVPKYKRPGIGIDIQGKEKERYKIRISGSRSRKQLFQISEFTKILLYLYMETYLFENEKFKIIKTKLKKLTKIAKRTLKVEYFESHTKEVKEIKKMTKSDPRRLAYRGKDGLHQWSRLCQNSGKDKRRQPSQYSIAKGNMEELLRKGYLYKSEKDVYEKRVKIGTGKKVEEIILTTTKVPEYDANGEPTGEYIYYTCNPEDNGEHMYLAFLTRSTNPYGLCMPCCNKKDPMKSNNPTKKEFFMKCLEKEEGSGDVDLSKKGSSGDILYILQDTNKIQEGRLGILPKYLDRYFNQFLGLSKIIKHNYLEETNEYFFKFGPKGNNFKFMNVISSLIDEEKDYIFEKIYNILKSKNNNEIFTSLNSGDLKTSFGSEDKYIDFLKETDKISHKTVWDILSIPGVLSQGGMNIVIFTRREIRIKRSLEKDKVIEDFYIENIDPENTEILRNEIKSSVFMIKDGDNYFPIVSASKDNKTKDVIINKIFKYSDNNNNIVKFISDFYEKSSKNIFKNEIFGNMIPAKESETILKKIGKKIINQIVDVRNKCRYLIMEGGKIIPVRPSGSIWNIKIIKNFDDFIDTFNNTLKYMNMIYKKTEKKIPIKPIGVYYESMEGNIINVIGIMSKTKNIIPVKHIKISTEKIRAMKLIFENKPLTDKIDEYIAEENKINDDRVIKTRRNLFHEESYQIFRLELSNFLNDEENRKYKEKLENIIKIESDIEKRKKIIRLMLYGAINSKYYDEYSSLTGIIEKVNADNFIEVVDNIGDVDKYRIINDRDVSRCQNKGKNNCSGSKGSMHCVWNNNKCSMGLTENMIIEFVNKASEELSENEMKANEILELNGYYVSDIVNRNKFTEMDGQRIIKMNTSNVAGIMNDIFGKDNIPNIGKRKMIKKNIMDTELMNFDNPPMEFKDRIIQKIKMNDDTILRAYANGYYWVGHKYYDNDTRNLGYYNNLQNDFIDAFKSMIIEWVTNKGRMETVMEIFGEWKKKDPIKEYVFDLMREKATKTNGHIELKILSKIYGNVVTVLDGNYSIDVIFDSGREIIGNNIEKEKIKYNLMETINLRYTYSENKTIDNIDCVYYLI
jgi:hypothetical protein